MSLAGGGPERFNVEEYADYEFQHIRVIAVARGDNDDETNGQSFEVLGGDLQHDELAMLANARLIAQADITGDAANQSQDQAGAFGCKAELGINNDGADNLTSDNRDTASFGDEDDPGILEVLGTGTATAPFVDTSAGAGGGGGAPSMRVDRDYMDMFGTGPFMSKEDEISTRVEVQAPNTVVDVDGIFTAQLGFVVLDVDDARAAFASPK